MQDFIDSPAADMFNTGEPDQSSWVPVFERRSFVDDVCFGCRTFDECLDPLDRLLKRFAECRISVSFAKSILVQPKVDFFSHKVTPKGIQADPKKMAEIAELPFPTTKKGMQAFLGALNYYGRFIQNLAVYGAILYQIKEDDFAPGGDLTAAKAAFAELKTKVIEAPMLRHFDSATDVHIMLFANEWALSIPADYDGYVLSFDGSAKTEKNGGYGSCSWILWRLPSWDIEIAASAHLPSTTVNIAEYTGMNNGVVAALQRGVSDLIIVGDSRLAIQQSMGVIACKEHALQVELARHKVLTKKLNSVCYLHVVRLYNSAADSMATEALEAKAGRVVLSLDRKAELKALNKIPEMLYTCENSADIRRNSATFRNQSADNSAERTEEPSPSEMKPSSEELNLKSRTIELLTELSEARTPDASDIDPLVVQAERRQRISKAQDEGLRWAALKAYLKGEFTQLSHRRVHNAGKVADEFVLSEDGLLYRQNKVRRPEELGELGLTLRLVVPTTMIDEVLQNCHNSIEGGHQGIVRTYHRVKVD
ncbi:unnamed protein product [Phytophthora fragariaefolia]|uniref:Unnamed protein product n=1 Tax=Phytophthora fragariaefolia TaxID=1490495 RepID=A0A9W6YEY3_9STRA|nr:unnamed protein product [Phytophthora fragariaefolia]